MATNNTIAKAAKNVRSLDTGTYLITEKVTLPVVAAGDSVTILTMPHDARLASAHLRVLATAGAGTTLKLQRNSAGARTDLTASTTAATAGVVTSAGLLPVNLLAGDTIEVLVSAGTPVAVAVEVDLLAQHA